jgi:hypothetical protein
VLCCAVPEENRLPESEAAPKTALIRGGIGIISGFMVPDTADPAILDVKITMSVIDELLKCWTPVQSLLPTYAFLDAPWQHQDKHLLNVVHDTTRDAIRRNHPGSDERDRAFQHEVSLTGAGVLQSVSTWCQLNQNDPCTLLAPDCERTVVEKVFGSSGSSDIDKFSAIASAHIPNMESLSWEHVLELRHHPYLERFREKLSSLEISVRNCNNETACKVIADLELSELRRLAKSVEPSVKSAAIKAFASNVPLPAPVNPVSVALGIKDIEDNVERQRSFGWLYFLMDF